MANPALNPLNCQHPLTLQHYKGHPHCRHLRIKLINIIQILAYAYPNPQSPLPGIISRGTNTLGSPLSISSLNSPISLTVHILQLNTSTTTTDGWNPSIMLMVYAPPLIPCVDRTMITWCPSRPFLKAISDHPR